MQFEIQQFLPIASMLRVKAVFTKSVLLITEVNISWKIFYYVCKHPNKVKLLTEENTDVLYIIVVLN